MLYRHYAIDARKVSRARYHEACQTRPELPRYPDETSETDQSGSKKKVKGKPKATRKRSATRRRLDNLPVADTPFDQQLLSSQREEALQWLSRDSEDSPIILGELDVDAAVEFVNRLYDSGACCVIAVEIDIDPIEHSQCSNHLLVLLPSDANSRKKIFEIENQQAKVEGLDGETDQGQQYLYFKMG